MIPAESDSSVQLNSSPITFDDILAAADLPPPGPDFYTARRRLWLTPRQDVQRTTGAPSTSRQRLERLLSAPNSVEDDNIWNNGIKRVWKTLEAGGRLKRRLPMTLIIRIIHAAWIRDDIWPTGAVAPEPDDILPDEVDLASPLVSNHIPASPMTEYSSAVTAPWMARVN